MKCSELVGPGELYPRRGPVWPVACVRAPAPATLHYSSDSSNVSLLASVAAMRAARSRRCTVNRRYLPAAFRYGRGSAATAPAWREEFGTLSRSSLTPATWPIRLSISASSSSSGRNLVLILASLANWVLPLASMPARLSGTAQSDILRMFWGRRIERAQLGVFNHDRRSSTHFADCVGRWLIEPAGFARTLGQAGC